MVAKYFDTAEINSSFYHPPAPETARSWLRRIEHNPNFVFTAKLFRTFTHERGKASAEDEKLFREGMNPLMDAGKLGAVLIQFPWSFKNEIEERNYLSELVARFKAYPLVVELRHESWNNARVLQTLEDLGVGLCDIDQPLFHDSIKPAAEVTSDIGYVRLSQFTEQAVKELGVAAEINKVTDLKQIAALGVMMTPALAVNGTIELAGRVPTLEEVNAVSPDTPVFILHLYDRAMVNGAGLRALGYTRETPNPPGGEILFALAIISVRIRR